MSCLWGWSNLFDGNGDSYGVDGALDEHSLLFITTDNHWSQEELSATPERGEEEGGREGVANRKGGREKETLYMYIHVHRNTLV